MQDVDTIQPGTIITGCDAFKSKFFAACMHNVRIA